MSEQVYINGTKLDSPLPLRALFFGEGLFETFRYKCRMPLFFDKHYDRMSRGARLLRIPLMERDRLAEHVNKVIINSGISDAYVKICLLSDGGPNYYDNPARGDIAIIVRDYNSSKERVRVCINKFARCADSPVRSIKSLNYLENIIARREASRKGYDEAIFLNERGEIAEGTAGNIFWVEEDTLRTPSVECGLLPGIIRELLMNSVGDIGLRLEDGAYHPERLAGSRMAFLTNSLSGTVLISELGETALPFDYELYGAIKNLVFSRLGWI
ncbi:MAG: aminotransferase class IV [Thermodesulfobacteriota bacterium]